MLRSSLARHGLVFLTIAAIAKSAEAQDQTVVVAPTPKVCKAFGDSMKATLQFSDATTLTSTALGAAVKDNESIIIHVLRYKDHAPTPDKTNWYAYNNAFKPAAGLSSVFPDAKRNRHFTETRLYGDRAVGVVYLHHNVPVATVSDAMTASLTLLPDALKGKADIVPRESMDADAYVRALRDTLQSYKRRASADADVANMANSLAATPAARAAIAPKLRTSAVKPTADLIDSLQSELAVEKTLTVAAASISSLRKGNRPDMSFVEANAKAASLTIIDNSYLINTNYLTVAYNVGITHKTPAPLQNLKDALSLAIAQAGKQTASVRTAPVSICAGSMFDVQYLPSDVAVTGTLTNQDDGNEKVLAKQTFDNERKYWYDFSFALPLKSYDDLSYSADKGTVTAKKVNKSDLFLVLNLGLPAFDTKEADYQLIPRFLYGMPITGQPLKHHLVGAAVGLTKLQVYGALVFNKDPSAPNATATSVEESKGGTWSRSWIWGINLPVSAVTAALKKK